MLGSVSIKLLIIAETLFMTEMSDLFRSVIFSRVKAAYVTSWFDRELGSLVTKDKLSAISLTFLELIVLFAYSFKMFV